MKRITLHMRNTGKPVGVDADRIIVGEELAQAGTLLIVNTGQGYSVQGSESYADVRSAIGETVAAKRPAMTTRKEK